MSTEADLIRECWDTLQEYIPVKEKQVAADHLITTIIDADLPHSDFVAIVNSDEYLRESAAEYLEDQQDLFDEE